MAHALFIIAQEGFQTTEFHIPKRILEEAGHRVSIASDGEGVAISNTGEKVSIDLPLGAVRAKDYDAVFLVGGPGALSHLDNPETHRIVQEAKANERCIFIC
jgi:protease I